MELLILLALVLVNGLFAGAEIAVLTAAKAKVQQRAAVNHKGALAVVALRDQPERFLATVQIGITVVGAAAAAFGGASIARDMSPHLEGLFGDSAHDVALVVVVAMVSFLSVVLGELVPKSLALRYASGYAFVIGRPLLALSKMMGPLVWFLTACSNLVLKLFGDRTTFTETRVSRDELRQLVEEAAKSGSMDSPTSEIAARALEFSDVTIAEVMVRRDKIVALPQDARPEEVQRLLLEEGHSRMPVFDRDLDHVVGYIVARDVLALAWEQNLVALPDIVRPLLAVPLSARVGPVLREMQAKRIQIAVVVDEHGGTAGLVTIEDLVEELIGDIFGEHDLPEETIRIADGRSRARRRVGCRFARSTAHCTPRCRSLARAPRSRASACRSRSRCHRPARSCGPSDGTVLEVVDASPRRVRMVRVWPSAQRDETEPGERQ